MPENEWSTIPEENQAIAFLQDALTAAAESLHAVGEAKYLPPAGGFAPER